MNLTHQAAFELMIEQGRGEWLSDEQRLALEQHLAGCEDCRLESKIVERLRQQASMRWPLSLEPAQGVSEMAAIIRGRFQRRRALRSLYRPSPGLAWVVGGILLVLWLSWVILNLVANPEPLPAGPARLTPAETQAPPATLEPAFAKTPVDPIFEAPLIGLGRPSPSGEYLYFLAADPKELGRSMASTQLHFYHVLTGDVCTVEDHHFSQQEVRKGFAWLADGRLLFVDAAGQVLALPPCGTGEAETLTGLFPEPVERLYAPGEGGEAVLVKGVEAYWVYEPASHRVRRVDAFQPGFVPRSDQIDFSPSGKRLAVSIMNGPTGQEGSRLYVLDLETLKPLGALDLPGSENQNAPWVDWVTEDWLVLPGPEKALLVNLAGGGLKTINIYRELFQLDVSQPFDVPSLDYQADQNKGIFHLAITSNIGGIHRIHLYHSEGGRVETLVQEADSLLILPDGKVLMAPYWEDRPTYRDEYDFLWVDSVRPPRRLTVEGHTPRDYPQLFPQILSPEYLAFGSSQGVSLYSIEDGRMLGFWSLKEYQGSGVPDVVFLEASGGLLVAASLPKSGEPGALNALYFIPLPR